MVVASVTAVVTVEEAAAVAVAEAGGGGGGGAEAGARAGAEAGEAAAAASLESSLLLHFDVCFTPAASETISGSQETVLLTRPISLRPAKATSSTSLM